MKGFLITFRRLESQISASSGLRFDGNRTEPNYFKLLERDGDYLLIGARYFLLKICFETSKLVFL